MFNVKTTHDAKTNKLHLEIDLNEKGEISASGKSMVIASTRGNTRIGDVMVGLNIYKPAPKGTVIVDTEKKA